MSARETPTEPRERAAPADRALCPVCRRGEHFFFCRALLYPGAEREIRRCGACGSAYFFPAPPPEEIKRCYPVEYFRGFFGQYWKDYYKGRAIAAGLSAWRAEGEMLDVGCAVGTLLAGARDHSRWRVRGLEFSPEAAAMGTALNGVEIAASSVSGAPYPDGSFDFVNMNNVLEHESDPAAALARVARLLKRGGRLELTVPNGPVDLLPTVTLYRRRGSGVITGHGGHLFFFTRSALELLLEAAGFGILSFRNFHFRQGLKARGLWPGAYRKFLRPAAAELPGETRLPLEEYRKLIPRDPGWLSYYAAYRLRRLFYAPSSVFGGDFKIIAERR